MLGGRLCAGAKKLTEQDLSGVGRRKRSGGCEPAKCSAVRYRALPTLEGDGSDLMKRRLWWWWPHRGRRIDRHSERGSSSEAAAEDWRGGDDGEVGGPAAPVAAETPLKAAERWS